MRPLRLRAYPGLGRWTFQDKNPTSQTFMLSEKCKGSPEEDSGALVLGTASAGTTTAALNVSNPLTQPISKRWESYAGCWSAFFGTQLPPLLQEVARIEEGFNRLSVRGECLGQDLRESTCQNMKEVGPKSLPTTGSKYRTFVRFQAPFFDLIFDPLGAYTLPPLETSPMLLQCMTLSKPSSLTTPRRSLGPGHILSLRPSGPSGLRSGVLSAL